MPLVQGLSQAAIKMLAGAVVLSEDSTEESEFTNAGVRCIYFFVVVD